MDSKVNVDEMFLFHLLKNDPFAGAAVCLTLVTLFWCGRTVRYQNGRADRLLMGLLGLLTMYEGLRVMRDSGLWTMTSSLHLMDSFADFVVAAVCLVAAIILRISSIEHVSTAMRLRLAEANEMLQEAKARREAAKQLESIAMFTVDANGEVEKWNIAAELVLGWTEEEVSGSSLPFGGEGIEMPPMKRVKVFGKAGVRNDLVACPIPLAGGTAAMVIVPATLFERQAAETAAGLKLVVNPA